MTNCPNSLIVYIKMCYIYVGRVLIVRESNSGHGLKITSGVEADSHLACSHMNHIYSVCQVTENKIIKKQKRFSAD